MCLDLESGFRLSVVLQTYRANRLHALRPFLLRVLLFSRHILARFTVKIYSKLQVNCRLASLFVISVVVSKLLVVFIFLCES